MIRLKFFSVRCDDGSDAGGNKLLGCNAQCFRFSFGVDFKATIGHEFFNNGVDEAIDDSVFGRNIFGVGCFILGNVLLKID